MGVKGLSEKFFSGLSGFSQSHLSIPSATSERLWWFHMILPFFQTQFFLTDNTFKRGSQHPSIKFEIFWQVAQSFFSLQLSYFVAQYVLIIVV